MKQYAVLLHQWGIDYKIFDVAQKVWVSKK